MLLKLSLILTYDFLMKLVICLVPRLVLVVMKQFPLMVYQQELTKFDCTIIITGYFFLVMVHTTLVVYHG